MALHKSFKTLCLAGASMLTALGARMEAEAALIEQRVRQARVNLVRGIAFDLKDALAPAQETQTNFYRDFFPVPDAPQTCRRCPLNSSPCEARKQTKSAPAAESCAPAQVGSPLPTVEGEQLAAELDKLDEGVSKDDLDEMYEALSGRHFPGFAAMARAWVAAQPPLPTAS